MQIKNGIAKLVNVNVKKSYSLNSSTCICENSIYLKSIADISVIEYDEIITVMDIVSTKKIYITATNVMSTASINCHNKQVKDCYIFAYRFISDNITIDSYYYLLSLCKTKKH